MIYRKLPSKPFLFHVPQKQKGLGMLEVLLFIAVLGGLAAAGYLQWQARETIKTAREERQSLSQADTALITFATVNHRLPCPDTNRDGLEDCTGNAQKGWLPSITLQLAGADPGVSTGQLRYLVQRGGATFDLATLGDDWRPLEYDGGPPATFDAIRATTASGGSYRANILTLADLCQRLEVASGTVLTTGMAQVRSSPARAVAYAVVHPGIADSDGNGSLFEDVNATATGAIVDDPARTPLIASYDDLVLERSFVSLQAAFDCQPLFQSINTLALGIDVLDQVDGMRQDNIAAANRAVAFEVLGAAMTGLELSASILEAASDSANAAADAVLCGATLGLAVNACAAIGVHVAAAVLAGTTSGAYVATIALNTAAAVAAGAALVLADSSVDAATLTCPVIDVARPLASARSERDAAVTKRNELQARLTAKQSELPPAVAALNTAYSNWLFEVRARTTGTSTIDFRVTNLRDAAEAWYTNSQNALITAAQVTEYQKNLTNVVNQVAEIDNQLANRVAVAAALRTQISTLEAQIAATSEGTAKEALKLELATASGKLSLVSSDDPLQVANRAAAVTTLNTRISTLETQIAAAPEGPAKEALKKELADAKETLVSLGKDPLVNARDSAEAERLKAVADLAAAVTANNTAQTNLTNSTTTYRNAYSAMLNATFGSYTVNLPGTPPTTINVCTERNPTPPVTCPTGSRQTRTNVINAVADVYGSFLDNGSAQPHPNSKFTRPKTIQKEIDALQAQVTVAADRVTRAQTLVDDLQAQVTSPPDCNITGTGVTPWSPTSAADLLLNVDTKGATR